MKIKCKRKTLHCELEWKNLNIAEIPNTQLFFLQQGYFYRVHSITKAWKQFIPPPPCHISRESSSSVTYPSCGPIKIKRLLQFLESPRRWDYPSRSLFPVWQGGSTQAVSWGKAPSCSHVWVTDTSSQPCKTGWLRFARSNQHLPAKQLSRNNHSNTQTLQSASIRDFASWDRNEFVILLEEIQVCPQELGCRPSASGEVKHHLPQLSSITPLRPLLYPPPLGWLRPNDEQSDPPYCKTQPVCIHELFVRAHHLLYCTQELWQTEG